MFENVTFRVITNFPTHSFESFSTLCCQLLLVTHTDMAPVTPKRAKAPKTPRTPLTPSQIRISLEQKLKLIDENVFNSLANLEKESLALSLQAKSSHQPKLTDFFNRK